MTGGDIVVALLAAHTPLTTAYPAGQIKLGALPAGVSLPALLVRAISSTDRQPLRLGARRRTTDRVSVTVVASSYREQRAGIALVRAACAAPVPAVAGATGISVLTAGTGPDLNGPADRFEQAQDFQVSFETTI